MRFTRSFPLRLSRLRGVSSPFVQRLMEERKEPEREPTPQKRRRKELRLLGVPERLGLGRRELRLLVNHPDEVAEEMP